MDAPLLLLLLLLLLLMLSAADAQLLIPLRKELPRFASLQLGRVSRKPSTGNFISLTRIFLPALRTNWRFRTQHGRSTCPNLEAGNSVRTREKNGSFHQMPRGLFLSGSGSSRGCDGGFSQSDTICGQTAPTTNHWVAMCHGGKIRYL